MKFKTFITLLFANMSLIFSSMALSSENFNDDLLALQRQWATANYSLIDDEQYAAFEQLIEQANILVDNNEDRAEPLVWLGIIQSSYAGAKGGLGALSLAKDAKKSLEKSIEINDSALSGSAYTSLGTLYHKVPGWPIGFGDDDDAKQFLEKAISINPNGIDPNYFYSEFLFDEREYKKAKDHLILALNAPTREERPLADESRRSEIQELLIKVEKKLRKNKN